LISLLIGSGTRDVSVGDLADRVIAEADGSVRRLGGMDTAALESVSGIGPATAARIIAALELGRRAEVEAHREGVRIRGPEDVYRLLGPRLRGLEQEEFHVLLLNTQNRVIREILVSRGILDASLVHPREVFRAAILEGAASVVVVHNHPSGDPTPSPEDRVVTDRIAEAGRTIGIALLDHVIIGAERFESMMSFPGGR